MNLPNLAVPGPIYFQHEPTQGNYWMTYGYRPIDCPRVDEYTTAIPKIARYGFKTLTAGCRPSLFRSVSDLQKGMAEIVNSAAVYSMTCIPAIYLNSFTNSACGSWPPDCDPWAYTQHGLWTMVREAISTASAAGFSAVLLDLEFTWFGAEGRFGWDSTFVHRRFVDELRYLCDHSAIPIILNCANRRPEYPNYNSMATEFLDGQCSVAAEPPTILCPVYSVEAANERHTDIVGPDYFWRGIAMAGSAKNWGRIGFTPTEFDLWRLSHSEVPSSRTMYFGSLSANADEFDAIATKRSGTNAGGPAKE